MSCHQLTRFFFFLANDQRLEIGTNLLFRKREKSLENSVASLKDSNRESGCGVRL